MTKRADTNKNGSLSELQARVAAAERENRLTTTRRDLLRAIIDNSEETYFLSSRELAKRFQMDTATVVRTIQALGYNRFADFAADLRKHFITRITPYQVTKTATEERRTLGDHVLHSLESDVQNMMQLRNRLDVERVLAAAKQIRGARKVLIVGIDFAASLAWSLDYGLSVVGVQCEAPIGTTGNLRNKVRSLTRKDLLIGISFGRCLRETVNAVLEAHKRQVPTLGITDSELSPIARHSDSSLLVSVAGPSLATSYAAATALVNCILIACAHISPKESLRVLRERESERESERWYDNDSRRNGKNS